MTVIVRLQVTKEQRRAIRKRKGERGLATRNEIRNLAEFCFTQDVDDAVAEYRATIPNIFDDLFEEKRHGR